MNGPEMKRRIETRAHKGFSMRHVGVQCVRRDIGNLMNQTTKTVAQIVTDSGGIQEETSFLGIPCLTATRMLDVLQTGWA